MITANTFLTFRFKELRNVLNAIAARTSLEDTKRANMARKKRAFFKPPKEEK